MGLGWRVGLELGSGVAVQLVVLGVLEAAVGVGPAGWVCGTGYALAVVTLLGRAFRRTGARVSGPANLVTLARSALVGGVTALVASAVVEDAAGRAPGVVELRTLGGLTALAIAADVLDGAVARRTGSASRIGARFDIEVDAWLVFVLSVLVAARLGWWVLAIGLMRYAFVAAARFWPWLRGSLPVSRARKLVGGLQAVALVASTFVPSRPAALVLVAGTLGSLTWSFGRDVRLLRRASRAPRTPRA